MLVVVEGVQVFTQAGGPLVRVDLVVVEMVVLTLLERLAL
jgi:hypothetical protein